MSTIAHSLRDYREPTKTQQVIHAFGLPSTETPLDEIPAVLSLSNPPAGTSGSDAVDQAEQEDQVYSGRLTLTNAYLCFVSLDRRSCRMTLPLYCVRRVERLNATRGGVFALAIVVWHGMRIVSRWKDQAHRRLTMADWRLSYQRYYSSTPSDRSVKRSVRS